MPTILLMIETPVLAPAKSPIIYDFSVEARCHNSNFLKHFDCDLEKLIEAHPDSDLSYGTESRPRSWLLSLLNLHPNWDTLKKYLDNGFTSSFHSLSEEDHLKDSHIALDRGNHKFTTHK